jgi:nitrogen fixation protein NifU and related proteins
MYSAQLLDYFQNPRNAGEVENPDAAVQIENPACGDVLRLSVRIEDGRVADIRFRAKGCVPAMACGSALTELAAGKSLQDVRGLKRETLIETVGGVPEASSHAGHLAMDALAALLQKLP